MESAQGAGGRIETAAAPASRPANSGAIDWLSRIAGSAWFAYGSILVIQSKVLWGIWDYRDLTPGDGSYYFTMASRWADDFLVQPAYYPLYNVLYGSLKWIVDDPFSVTILHRVLIVLGTTVLLLAVMRRLLTPGIAWALALWWAVLPAAYDTIFEIHLLSALVGLAIVLLALRWSGLAGRATVFGLLLAAALLVRNEYIVAAFVFGVVWLGYELWRMRRGTGAPWRSLAAAVAIPLLTFAILFGLVSWRSAAQGSVYSQLAAKNELAFCQGYALGLDHAGDVRTANPLAQCTVYTREDFGEEMPSLAKAIADNPDAVAGHFGRNARLFPAGLEIGLFNAKFGPVGGASNPDYIPVNRGSWLVLAGSLAVVAAIVAGAVLIWRERRRWWNGGIHRRVWGWAVLGSVGCMGIYAGLMTRPRPSYIFSLTILVLALLGLSLVAIARRLGVPRRARAVIPPLAVAAVILIPNHYRAGYANPQIGPGQRLKTAVSRLEPYRTQLVGREHGLLAVYPATDACLYVGGSDPCTAVSWNYPIGETLGPELAGREQHSFESTQVDFIYADEYVFTADPGMRARLSALLEHGWRRLAPTSPSGWMLLERDAAESAPG
jgi:hypothetical protein